MTDLKRRRTKEKDSKKVATLFNSFLLICYLVLCLLLIMAMFSYNILSVAFLQLLISIVLGALGLLFIWRIVKKKGSALTSVGLIIMIALLSIGLYGVKSVVDVSSRMNQNARLLSREMSVLVLKDSPVTDVSEVTSVAGPKSIDASNIDLLLNQIKKEKTLNVNLLESTSYAAAYQSLLSGEAPAMVMNGAYLDLVKSQYEDFESKVKEIYTYTIEEKIERTADAKPSSDDVFNIYISGIDTHGPISSVSRSDVNIIMTVNRKTHKILLTTTPRDSYVPIAGGGNNQSDKLTHAGIYGVDASIKTLENLYGITIDHYARINFTSFMTLIDLVGGVDVYNDQAFTAHTNKNYSFNVGNVHLDSQGALAFVRERYSLEHGDNDRGKNQQKVIAALINKLTSINSMARYQDIVNGLGDSIQTDVQVATMMSFVNDQIAAGKQYEVTSQSLTGSGSIGQFPSYAMPEASLYMFSIDESSLNQAKVAIQTIMEGR